MNLYIIILNSLKLSNTYLGILFAILAYLSFSFLDAIQKTLVIYHTVFQMLFIKYFFTLFLSFIEGYRKKNLRFFKTKNLKIKI